jgi:hypothetical protein
MPKPTQRAEVSSFIGGFNTEASLLTFPPNVSSDEQNFELNRDGSRARRLGLDYTTNFVNSVPMVKADVSPQTANSFLWNSVNGDTNLNFIVVQTTRYLSFYDQVTLNPVLSLTSVQLTNMPVGARFDFAALEGRLVVAGNGQQIAVVEYDSATPRFNLSYQSILTRDLWGIESTIANFENDPNFNGNVYDGHHYYNLTNQSWGVPRNDNTGNLTSPARFYNTGLGRWPSNSEQVWAGLAFQSVATSQIPFERMFVNLWQDVRGAKGSAAKGYYIIDALTRGISRNVQFSNNLANYPAINPSPDPLPTIPTDTTSGGATVVTDFAGRIFYGGFSGTVTGGDARSPILNNYLFFSQLVKNRADLTKCYQEGDPTSRDSSDIVDTDGGFIRIAGAQQIVHLQNIGISLLVFATNGVWAVTGGTTDSGFSATNYKVNKITNNGTTSPSSVVVDSGVCYYWSQDGIYVIGPTQIGDLQSSSLTLDTIQKYYRDIPISSKANARGVYDFSNKQLRWIFKTGTLYSATSQTWELVFDPQLKAFTKHYIGQSNDIEVMGMVSSANLFYRDPLDTTSKLLSVRYIVFALNAVDHNNVHQVFAHYKDKTWKDWATRLGAGAIDASAFITTGTQIASDSGIDKQIPYLVLHFRRTETGVDANYQPTPASSCLFRGQWNFSDNSNSNQWTPLRQGYRYVKPRLVTGLADDYDTGYALITTKNKLRGKGKAFALHFETEPGKDCQIVGWNISINANNVT